MSIRRATPRAASAIVAVASVLLLATCDIATLTKPNEGGTPGNPFDSTELTLSLTGTTLVNGATTIPLGGTGTMSVTSATVSLDNVVKRYYSAGAAITVDSLTGAMTGVTVGTPVKVTAMILAPELGGGVTISRQVRVRYNGLKVTTPLVTDTIKGLGPAQNKTATVFGTNVSGANVLAVTPDSVRSRDTTIFKVTGTTINGRKNGTAQMVAFFDGLRDSVLVRVRQVAKNITFPTVDYTARHMNFGITVPIGTVTDLTDSLIPPASRVMKWRTKDTTKAAVDSLTGVLRVKVLAGDTIFARMDTVERKQRIVVAQVPGSLTKFQGDARSDTVAKNVSIVPTVTVLDSGNTPIVGAMVQFKTGLGLNASVNDTVAVASDANGRAKPTSWKIGDVAGANNNTLIATAANNATTTFTVTAIAGQPRKVAFVVHPTSASQSTAISPSIQVQIQDSLGNHVTNAGGTVTLSFSNNPNAAVLSGTLTAGVVSGVATFAGISINNTTGAGYTLLASSGSLQSGVSNAFDIFGAKNKLGFTTQPSNTVAGATMSTVRVAIQDANGATITSGNGSTDNVSLAILANPGGGTLTGGASVAAVAGIATFPALSINNAGNGYTFQATAATLPNPTVTSNIFNVAPVGAPAKLAFQQQPSNAVSGSAIAPSITVRVLDASGALVTSSTQQITLSIDPSSPTGGAINAGTTSQNAVGGVATFPGIQINKANTGYKLLATATGTTLTTATSSAFNITAGTATKLGFVQQPVHTTGGTTMPVTVTVELQDANSNRVTTGAAVGVSLAIASGTCTGATLSGGGSVNTVSGVASFAALGLSANATNNCQLTAAAVGLTTATSTTFTSNASTAAARLKFTTQPTAAANAGTVIPAVGTVNIQDAAGNNVAASANVSISLSVATGPSTTISNCTTSLPSTTSVSFTNCIFNTAGSYRLVANATGYRPDTSAIVVISAGAATKVGFLTQPSSANAGVPFATPIQVAVQDAQGNTVTGSSAVLTLSTSMAGAPFTQGRFNNGNLTNISVAASSGIATFTNLAQYTAGVGYRMNVGGPSLGGANSVVYDVAAGPPAKLGFVVQPQNNANVATAFSPDVQVSGQDSVGNTLPDFGTPITLALTGGTAGASLVGTKTVTPQTGGISTFASMSVDRMGTAYQLTATASGVASGTSNTFNINPFVLNSNGFCCGHKGVVVGSTFYFAASSALRQVPLTGGSATVIQGSNNAAAVATDGTNIFWIERGTNNNGDAFIKKYQPSGGTVSTLTVAMTTLMDDDASKLYTDGTNVYFFARNAAGTGYAIQSVSVNATSASPAELYNPGDFRNLRVFYVTGGFIYIYDSSLGQVIRMPTGGGPTTTLTSGSNSAQRMALAGTTLYFNDGVTIKAIANAASAGGPAAPAIAFTAPGTVYDVASSGGLLYFNFDGTIRRYNPADFTTFATLGENANTQFWAFEFDATYVYWNRFSQWVRVPK
jgi:hypothetical protein